MRIIDDLIRMAHRTTAQQGRMLLDFSQLVHDHPALLEQLAERLYSRLETNNRAASVKEVFERLRWDIHVSMRNGLSPLMARALLYLHPDLNGMVQLVPLPLDEALGMRVSLRKLPGDYAKRLQWADGSPLSEPQPTFGVKPVQSVRPQGELFEVAG
jgi:hypothetical protein